MNPQWSFILWLLELLNSISVISKFADYWQQVFSKQRKQIAFSLGKEV
jgi:hypothetical protein